MCGGGEADANGKMEKDKEKTHTRQGHFDLLVWHRFNTLCLLLAGDRQTFPGQPHPLSTAHFRHAISELPAEVEGEFAKTVDSAKPLPDENPAA